jgi:hypothetical protein
MTKPVTNEPIGRLNCGVDIEILASPRRVRCTANDIALKQNLKPRVREVRAGVGGAIATFWMSEMLDVSLPALEPSYIA